MEHLISLLLLQYLLMISDLFKILLLLRRFLSILIDQSYFLFFSYFEFELTLYDFVLDLVPDCLLLELF
jgi:hypothetical protein